MRCLVTVLVVYKACVLQTKISIITTRRRRASDPPRSREFSASGNGRTKLVGVTSVACDNTPGCFTADVASVICRSSASAKSVPRLRHSDFAWPFVLRWKHALIVAACFALGFRLCAGAGGVSVFAFTFTFSRLSKLHPLTFWVYALLSACCFLDLVSASCAVQRMRCSDARDSKDRDSFCFLTVSRCLTHENFKQQGVVPTKDWHCSLFSPFKSSSVPAWSRHR